MRRLVPLPLVAAMLVAALLAAAPLAPGSSWLLAAYDELLWNLNAPARGARQGFDRNRLFLGVVLGAAWSLP